MRIRIMFLTGLVFAALPDNLSARLNAPGAIAVDTTNYNTSTLNDTVFVFPEDEMMTVRYENSDGANIAWYRHNPVDNSWDTQVGGGSQLSVTDLGGYRVVVENDIGDVIADRRFWVYNNQSIFNAEAEVVFDDCFNIELAASSESVPLIFYDPADGTPGRVNYQKQFKWSTEPASDEQQSGNSVTFDAPLKDLTYMVSITDRFGNEAEATVDYTAIAVKAEFETEILKDSVEHERHDEARGSAPIEIGFTDESSGHVSAREWVFGDAGRSVAVNPTFVFSEAGTDSVTLRVVNRDSRCEDISEPFIVNVWESELDVPNVFTPNGDGTNDEFRVAYRSIKEFEMVVYNRWGRKVYQSTDPTKGWDGKVGGKTGVPGVYFYYIKAEGYNKDEKYRREGPVHLIRRK